MKKYKCIIFDLDGTMLDTEKMNMIPLQRLIKEELSIDIKYEDLLKYRAYAGKTTLKMLGFKDIEASYSKWVKYISISIFYGYRRCKDFCYHISFKRSYFNNSIYNTTAYDFWRNWYMANSTI